VNPLASLDTLMGMLSIANPELKGLLEAQTEATFVEVFERGLERAIRTVESNAKHYGSMKEPGLSQLLADLLRQAGFRAEAEANHNGHVDLKVESWFQPAWKCLGECKIYNGYEYHIGGLKQLLGYGTGAQAKLFLIDFFKKAGMYVFLEGLKKEMDAQRPHGQVEEGKQHPMKGGFETRHPHVSGATVTIAHLGCNVAV
jgi:hypothetical protein